MTDLTLKQQQARDRKESHLAIWDEQQRVSEDMYMRAKKTFKKELAKYQKWKEDNGIPGIKY
jgi:hypothetical protein